MNPLEKWQQRMKIVTLVKQSRKPLPTTFKEALCVSLPTELVHLARTLKSEYNVNISAELAGPIQNRLVKLAHQINKKLKETQKNGVDSQH